MAPPESGISSSDQPDLVECIPMLRPYVARHVPRDQVEDFLQEIMLRLHQRQSTSPIDNFRAYAFQTARSVIVDRGRRDTVRKQDEHFALTELHHPVDHITPEQVLLGRESLQRLAAALERMPERTRDIFVLQRFEEMSYPAIAEHLEISLSAVGKHMVKALRLLAEEVFP